MCERQEHRSEQRYAAKSQPAEEEEEALKAKQVVQKQLTSLTSSAVHAGLLQLFKEASDTKPET